MKILTSRKLIGYQLFVALIFGGAALAHTAVELPDPGLTPESTFYFLDRFGEALREFFTFNPEGKARLQLAFTAERISEIKVILEAKGVQARGLDVAQSRLLAHLASASAILDDQRAEGKDVSSLASELDDEFDAQKAALKLAFDEEKQAFKAEENELRAKIREARRAGNTAEVEALLRQLADVKTQLELLEQEEEEQEEALEREEERIEEEMDAKVEAEKAIREAEEEKEEVTEEAAEESVTIPPEAFNAFNHHIAEAKEALTAGKFEEAHHHAEEAKENLEKIEEASGDLGETKAKEEELKEEQEDKEQEAQEKQDGRLREDAEKEAERLKKERRRAEEEARKAEERLREVGKEEDDD